MDLYPENNFGKLTLCELVDLSSIAMEVAVDCLQANAPEEIFCVQAAVVKELKECFAEYVFNAPATFLSYADPLHVVSKLFCLALDDIAYQLGDSRIVALSSTWRSRPYYSELIISKYKQQQLLTGIRLAG